MKIERFLISTADRLSTARAAWRAMTARMTAIAERFAILMLLALVVTIIGVMLCLTGVIG